MDAVLWVQDTNGRLSFLGTVVQLYAPDIRAVWLVAGTGVVWVPALAEVPLELAL